MSKSVTSCVRDKLTEQLCAGFSLDIVIRTLNVNILRGNVGRQHQSEGDNVVTRGQVGALVHTHLVLHVFPRAGEVVSQSLTVNSPCLGPEHLSLPHQLHVCPW